MYFAAERRRAKFCQETVKAPVKLLRTRFDELCESAFRYDEFRTIRARDDIIFSRVPKTDTFTSKKYDFPSFML